MTPDEFRKYGHQLIEIHIGLRDMLASTYRGFRAAERARLASLDAIDVTLSRDLLLLVRDPSPGA